MKELDKEMGVTECPVPDRYKELEKKIKKLEKEQEELRGHIEDIWQWRPE
jgi:hypothetical protein